MMSADIHRSFDPAKIFPLRLTPFEEYFFVDHRRRQPMSENLTWIFRGPVDRDLMAAAFRRAIAFEPLLFAVVRRQRGRLFWTFPSPPLEPTLICSETEEMVTAMKSGSLPLDSFDLTRELPARFRLVTAPDGFLIHSAVHHALTDGIGLARFLGNWFAFYREELRRQRDASVATDDSDLFLPEPERLREREDYHVELPEKVSLWDGLRYTVSETFLWFCRRPFSLTTVFLRCHKEASRARSSVPNGRKANFDQNEEGLGKTVSYPPTPGAVEGAEPSLPRMFWRTLSVEQTEAYRCRAKRAGVSVNSLLIRDVFIGLARWTGEPHTSKKRGRKRFRLLVPVSLRNRCHERIPVANMIGYVFLDRFSNECSRSAKFLTGIETQMREIRRWSVGLFFLDGLRFFRRIPGALRFLTSRLFCHATLVFSNTGILCQTMTQPEFRDAANLRTEDGATLLGIVGSPPVRPNTPVSVGVIGHGGEMIVTFCVDPTVAAEEDRDALMNACFEEFHRSADDVKPVAS